jgi:hypothetical protein
MKEIIKGIIKGIISESYGWYISNLKKTSKERLSIPIEHQMYKVEDKES